MLLRHAIGATLRRIRLDRSLTLRVVADDASISMPYLSEIERGRKEASSEILAVICRALGMTVIDLLREVTDEAAVVDLAAARAERTDSQRTDAERTEAERTDADVVAIAA